jgi:hypothetical protein
MNYGGLPRVQVISASHILTYLTLAPVKPILNYLKESTK